MKKKSPSEEDASMGPRHECRGERALQSIDEDQRLLQWGHGTNAVESIRLNGELRLYAQLQWGHGTNAVERHPDCEWCARTASFNGATARMPWRGRRRGPRRGLAVCFNGATARMPWREERNR